MNTSPATLAATKELFLLQPFAGLWNTEGEIIATDDSPPLTIKGTDHYAWLPGGFFMLHQVNVFMGDENILSTEIIGYDTEMKKYTMHYFGHNGSTGLLLATFNDNQWQFLSETERFTGSFNNDNTVMEGIWEQKKNDQWLHWMNIRLYKQP